MNNLSNPISPPLIRFTLGMLMMWGVQGCLSFRASDKQVRRYFHKRNLEVKIHQWNHNQKEFRAVETGINSDSLQPLIIFIHGAPGSSDAFYEYLADSVLLEKGRMVAVDRLGYGFSGYGKAETSIEKQAEIVGSVIDKYKASKVILVGHSFGGPVAAKCAMDYSESVAGVLLLAPAIDPEIEKIFWFSHFGRWRMTRWMLPGSLKVAADEKFSHVTELSSFSHQWKQLNMPVIHMHGNKDRIVPYENVDFSRKMVSEEFLKIVTMEGEDHYIPWTRLEAVRAELLELINQ